MKKTIIALALTLAMVTPSHAFFGGGDDITNNYNTTNTTYNQGGKGGKATAKGVGVGIAGAAASNRNTNNIDVGVRNRNSVRNNVDVGVGVNNADYNKNININRAKGGDARQHQGQGQDQGQLQGQKQSNSQGQSQAQDTSQANAQSMTYNESEGMHYSGRYEVETMGTSYAPDIQATAGCRKPLSVGASWLGGAFSAGTTFLDETCVRFENIRFGLTSDNPETRDLANQVLQRQLMDDLVQEDEVAQERIEAISSLPVANTNAGHPDLL